MSDDSKTISEWLKEYRKIIESSNISEKTVDNRRSLINWIEDTFGDRHINSIKPYEIAIALKLEYKKSTSKAKRLLIETKNMFNEAMIYDWTEKNPAALLKAQPVIIQRERLSLEEWKLLLTEACLSFQPWVSIMLKLALVTGQRRSDLSRMKWNDVWGGFLHITQQKTNAKLAIPLSLRLNAVGLTVADVISDVSSYDGDTPFICKHNGKGLVNASLSAAFERLVDKVIPGKNTSLHECRSLSERLYRKEGLDTRILLGHKHQSMTDLYNDERGLNGDVFIEVPLNNASVGRDSVYRCNRSNDTAYLIVPHASPSA